jgi:hypothetical protein
MIVNVLRFAFRPEVTAAEQAEVVALMRRTAAVESVAFSTVGQDLGDPADGFTHAYLVAIPDLAALERYMHDPVHIAGDRTILGRLARLAAVRLADDPDPELGRVVGEMHGRKAAAHPEWGRAVEELMS